MALDERGLEAGLGQAGVGQVCVGQTVSTDMDDRDSCARLPLTAIMAAGLQLGCDIG